MHVQHEVPEPQRQRRLPWIIPPVAVPARRHARLLHGPALRGQKGDHRAEAGHRVDTGGDWPD